MYKVIKFFTDLQDNNYPYEVGSTYPRKGLSVAEERIAELSGSNNRQRTALIKEVSEPKQESKENFRENKENVRESKEKVQEPKAQNQKKKTKKKDK